MYRYRHHPGVDASEERDDEVEARRAQNQRAFTRGAHLLQNGCRRPRPVIEFAESQLGVFFAIGRVAAVVESGLMTVRFGSLPCEF